MKINISVRENLQLNGKGQTLSTLEEKSFTQAQIKEIKHYKETINKLKIAHREKLHSNNTKNKIRKNKKKKKKIFNVISMD